MKDLSYLMHSGGFMMWVIPALGVLGFAGVIFLSIRHPKNRRPSPSFMLSLLFLGFMPLIGGVVGFTVMSFQTIEMISAERLGKMTPIVEVVAIGRLSEVYPLFLGLGISNMLLLVVLFMLMSLYYFKLKKS